MRTIIKETTVYKFGELPDESQKKALDNYRDINVDYPDWDDYVIEYWQEKLASIGFDDVEIQYSGFWSQGDGASFTADVDFLNLLPTYIDYALEPNSKQAKRLIALALAGYFDGAWKIERMSYHYMHENTISCSETYGLDCLVNNEILNIEQNITDLARHYSREVYASLEKEYDFLTSDESVKRALIINGYEFTLDGKIY